MIDVVGGRIAYKTHYVYFQFSYLGKVTKILTFTSMHYRPLAMDKVQDDIKNAATYAEILKIAKLVAFCKEAS